jgi:Cu-Zn family superoxide dismutase
MKSLKLVVLGVILITTYNCKEAKKEAKEATGEMEKVVEEVKVESVKFSMEPKSDSGVQ